MIIPLDTNIVGYLTKIQSTVSRAIRKCGQAAYVTETALLGQGNYYIMAGVSAACITPPLVLDINRFSQEDRTAALVNYVLGPYLLRQRI